MKNSLKVFSFILLLVCGCSTSKKARTNIDPIMTFEPLILDLGEVVQGEVKEMEFKFTNTGKQSLEIELATGCQCSDITAPTGKSFAPGEVGTIQVVFHSAEEKDFGPQKKTIDLLLVQTDPSTGYQIVKQFWYTVNLLPK